MESRRQNFIARQVTSLAGFSRFAGAGANTPGHVAKGIAPLHLIAPALTGIQRRAAPGKVQRS